MAKTIATIKAVCMNASKNKNGSAIIFAKDVTPKADGITATARTGISVNIPDKGAAADLMVIDKEYTLTITE